MARGRRYLIGTELDRAERRMGSGTLDDELEACPQAAALTEEVVDDFLAAAHCLDSFATADIVPSLRRAGLAIPAELTFDSYRVGRFLFRRWQDPQVREAVFTIVRIDYRALARMRRRMGPDVWRDFVHLNGPSSFSILRRAGLQDCAAQMWAALPEDVADRCRAWLKMGRVVLHRYLTEPEPTPQPTHWEQQKLARRIHLRDVQLRSLRRSQHRLRRERKQLASRLHQVGLGDQPELAALAAELEQLRRLRREAAQRHATELADQAGRFGAEIDQWKADLANVQQDHRELLKLRASWLPDRRGETYADGLVVSGPALRTPRAGAAGRRMAGG